METRFEGGCLCGQVRFEVRGPTLWCAHCHCRMCQKAHGAGHVTWVGAKEADFAITEGAQELVWYRSSPEARRGFCRACGSSIFFVSTRWPGEMHITRANFDGDIDRAPQVNVFCDSHVDWEPMDERLPRGPV